ncbi:tRNA(Met) cytidine acetyltransferase TmcA [Halomonas icarae]|uniref:tRNA(Met) cytidine acetyltransferase TmcA n=1 Tax=Halomonas icarae TaxID=2691040 RepID=A0A7X4W3C9_9GAMM|nr:GNAT family N-acetyltransferase [Halomonas icarae]MDR5900586.1 GNAT family N-acetyltransferase [Halomonas icarae]NAW13943.1 GNAT family N-acetyltransferase [Halomonas icarae]
MNRGEREHDLSTRALLAHISRLARRRWRGLVWLQCAPQTCCDAAVELWRAGAWHSPLWVAPELPGQVDTAHWLAPARARTRLGGEHDLLVIDAVSAGAGFDPDAVAALVGTLTAGGLLVLMTPHDWGGRPDADYARLAEHPWRPEALTSRYLARLARLLARDDQVIRWRAGETPRLPRLPIRQAHAELPLTDGDCLTDDQAQAVARLARLRRRRPLVITADRGRGKSAALGIACARWLATGEQEVLVTAPRPAAVESLFERLAALCPQGERRGHVFATDQGEVRFVAPDALAELARQGQAGGAGRLLLVDEAAAIPAGLLGEWLDAFPRIAFATTVHGYEGSGRGFALRFRERLERTTPEWRGLHLADPIRWASDDPLEPLIHRLLMLDADPPEPHDRATDGVRRLSRATLAGDEPGLRSLFGLLVQAHYRTTPSDLRLLLDGPGLTVGAMTAGDVPLGVVMTADEGGFEADLAEGVARGERRPRGHLMAQSLAAHVGSREALTGHLRRVVRIAVAPQHRREGLGKRLIEAELERARDDGCDLLGASFGAEPALMAFWQRQGFHALRLGLTRETATGEHALMVARATSKRGEALMGSLVARFQRALPGLLAFELRDLAPPVAAALLAEGCGVNLADDDRRDAEDVAAGHREPALARPALQALVRLALSRGISFADPELLLLVTWGFQGLSGDALARHLGVSGRRQATARLRQAVAMLLSFSSPSAMG